MANVLNPKHAVYGVKAYLSIAGKKIPIVRCSMEFVLNQIPIATVQVPSGFKLGKASAVRDQSTLLTDKDLEGRQKVQILVSGQGVPHPDASSTKATPTGNMNEVVVFDGYLLSKSIQFSASANATTLVLGHWLMDLDSSTFTSGAFAKNSPSEWFVQEFTSGKPNPELAPIQIEPTKFISSQDVLDKEWWQDIVYPAIKYKANLRLLHFVNNPVPTETQPILDALAKINSYGMLKLNNTAKLDLSSEIGFQIKKAMYHFIYPGGGSSGFEKLVGLFSYFGVALAPRVDDCALIPYNPVAKVEKTIPDSECDMGSSNANVSLLPRGAIVYGTPIAAGKVNIQEGYKYDSAFLGEYSAPKGQEYLKGPWISTPLPQWLSYVTGISIPGNQFDPIKGILPDNETPSANGAPPEASKLPRSIANAIAKAHYFNTLFATKYQDVICGLRFDIAPGDCVQVEGQGDTGQNISGLSGSWKKRGIVESVSIVLDSTGGGQINTTIRLKHVFDTSDIEIFKDALDGDHPMFLPKPSGLTPLKTV